MLVSIGKSWIIVLFLTLIGINHVISIGYFLTFNENLWNFAAFIIFTTMIYGSYKIISQKPWIPSKKIVENIHTVDRLKTIRVRNEEMNSSKFIEELPIIQEDIEMNKLDSPGKSFLTPAFCKSF